MQTEFHIGIDDTDSRLGGCTTYTASLLFDRLKSQGFEPIDYPWLVRLNPNVPFKTRGNGALSLHFVVDVNRLQEAKETALASLRSTVDLSPQRTDPAMVFLVGAVPSVLSELSERALHDMISVSEARKIAHDLGIEVHLLKGSRGLVGALASIGANLDSEHTFEIIAYRKSRNIGTVRRVDRNSIRAMDEQFQGWTFNNVDQETGRVLVCPHGPDPVLLGIRGESPDILAQAFRQIRIGEEIENAIIFRTNQGTDAHLRFHQTISKIRRYQSVVIKGRVVGKPRIIRGGHAVFNIEDGTGSVDCAAYRATGSIRDSVVNMVPGDSITVSGGVRRFKGSLSLNVEKLEVTGLVDKIRFENPRCSTCGARCESMGKNQGFRCKKCKARFPRSRQVKKIVPRKITLGVYLPPPRAHRHLTKPFSRYGIKGANSPRVVDANCGLSVESGMSISTVS